MRCLSSLNRLANRHHIKSRLFLVERPNWPPVCTQTPDFVYRTWCRTGVSEKLKTLARWPFLVRFAAFWRVLPRFISLDASTWWPEAVGIKGENFALGCNFRGSSMNWAICPIFQPSSKVFITFRMSRGSQVPITMCWKRRFTSLLVIRVYSCLLYTSPSPRD